jgi:hypothetical protein
VVPRASEGVVNGDNAKDGVETIETVCSTYTDVELAAWRKKFSEATINFGNALDNTFNSYSDALARAEEHMVVQQEAEHDTAETMRTASQEYLTANYNFRLQNRLTTRSNQQFLQTKLAAEIVAAAYKSFQTVYDSHTATAQTQSYHYWLLAYWN